MFVDVGALVRERAHPTALELAAHALEQRAATVQSRFHVNELLKIVASGSDAGLERVCMLRLDHPLLHDADWVWFKGGDIGKRALAERFGRRTEPWVLPAAAGAQVLEGAAATRAKIDALLSTPTANAKLSIAALIDHLAGNPKFRSDEWTALAKHLSTVLPESEASFVAKARALAQRWSRARRPKK